MSERISFSTNGQAGTNGTTSKATKKSKSKARQPRAKRLPACRAVAIGVGIVGAGVLALSVLHCTEAIALLTGSHFVLAGLLAVGIDAGLVACEMAALVCVGHESEKHIAPWAQRYIATAVVLSMLLNSYAFSLHAAQGMAWAGYVLGVVIPCLIYMLGRVAGELWRAGK